MSATISEAADGLPPSLRTLAMLAVGIAVFMAVLDGSIANVALPTIARQMHATPAEAIWVINSYQLAVTVSLLPMASLGDIYGHRRVYCWGVALYTIASMGCAVSTTLPQLVLGRVMQGFGGAGIMSVNGALIRFIFPRSQLGRGVGYNVLVVGTSSAAGPSAAAAILAVSSWPWLFAAQVPFGLIALGLSVVFLPRTPRSRHAFDLPSAALNAVTLGLFITGLDGLGHGEGRQLVVAELAGAVLAGVVFVCRQLRLRPPMLPIDLLIARPIFALSSATSICAYAAAIIALVILPFYFQYAGGLTAIQVGLVLTPWPAAVIVMAPIAGRLADRYSAGLLGGFGLLLMAAGLVTVALVPAATAAWPDIAWRLILCGVGFGLFQSPNNRLLLGSVPVDRAGAGSGMLSTSRLVGQTTGSAIVAMVLGLTHGGADSIVWATHIAIGVAAASAILAMGLSWLRMLGQ
ncbi:MFS transporter [Rhodopila sp.]|uniref:MFS transporter n=1 Tax=Rhodopila sp. TaxID=2480087 RepID=UPI002C9F31F1|nr:MFS transporter [Rhodopila sp.]HVZ10701.1 MFS transporter [Rhodopila sp.]